MDREFSAVEVCRLAGVTYRQLWYWVDRGHVRPSLAFGRGSGSKWRFSRRDLGVVWALGGLADMGVTSEAFAAVAVALESVDLGAGGFLVVAPDGFVEVVATVEPAVLARGVATVLALDTTAVLEGEAASPEMVDAATG